jgi:thiol-disulfide isomerase/thioredoxin/copper chaperone CopZ
MATAQKLIPITRMDCPTCIPVLEKEVMKLEGVTEARGNYMTKNLRVTYNPENVQLSQIEAAIERVGYQISYKKYPGVFDRLKNLFKSSESSKVPQITDEKFNEKVMQSSKNVAVLFTSPTCPTCRVFKPRFEKLAEKNVDADFYEMDIVSTETWRDYDVMSLPTVLVFKAGKLSERFTALPREDEIEKAVS